MAKKKSNPNQAKGGKTTLERHGKTHFSKAAKIRWDKEKAKKAL